jgi:uncharacterized protein (TIGR04255 family)
MGSVDESARERRIYKNPPVVEAVCTFTFDADKPWNFTIPGRLYDKVKDAYPEEPEQQVFLQTNLAANPGESTAEVKVEGTSARFAFKNGPKILSVMPHNISVHSLAPYEGWESLKGRACEAFSAFREIVESADLVGVSLRYLNRVYIPERQFSFGEYFTVAQALPPAGFPSNITKFFDRMERAYADAPVTIVFTWASEESAADRLSFLMDFDLQRRGEIEPADVPEILEDLRRRERDAFESLIQDSLRGIFDAAG